LIYFYYSKETPLQNPYDLKEKDLLAKLYHYISHNRQGITNQVNLKDQQITRTGAIKSNVKQAITTLFNKKGMSCSKREDLALLKVKETILNGRWDDWWKKEREYNIQVSLSKPPLAASSFTQEAPPIPLIQALIPALSGPHQDRPRVGVLRKLTEVGY
jgi:hypothetical protein